MKSFLLFIATWMDLEGMMLNEISQAERQRPCGYTYMWNLKNKIGPVQVAQLAGALS